MDVWYDFQGMLFEWDEEKSQLNIVKHGVKFEQAAEVFFDPFYQTGDASDDEYFELRDFVLGYSLSERMLLVIYTERDERTRIISARVATRYERRLYEQ